MSTPLKILCVHGVGHGEADPNLQPSWRAAIVAGLRHWNPHGDAELRFVPYDDLFAQAPLNAGTVTEALFKLGWSGLVHGLGDLFGRRGLGDVSEALRWTAGMVAQWADNDGLRARTRRRVLDQMKDFQPDVICAHSLGSLITYDTFVRPENRRAIANRTFITFGSQIGNPFVRNALGGRITDLSGDKAWYHLFNVNDKAFAARIRLNDPDFFPVETEFDIAGILDHDAIQYLTHANTVNTVWCELAGGAPSRALNKSAKVFQHVLKKPAKRALLVGINDYPDPQNRLEGCANDVFLMSSVLQESGFDPDNIRVVLNERATRSGILDRLNWLLDGAADGDDRVFFYSGHGAQIPGYGVGETVDHLDECLVPYDFNWTRENAVTDDQFYELYSQLPYDARFLTILDCCHSGGMTRDGALRVRGLTPPDDIRHRQMRWNAAEQMWETRDLGSVNKDVKRWKGKTTDQTAFVGQSGATHRLGRAMPLRALPDRQYNQVRDALNHHGPYLPVILEACQEEEFSYEYRHGVVSYGAFTYSLAKTFRQLRRGRGQLTWQKLVDETTRTLHSLRYDQTPSLVCPGKLRTAPVPWIARGGKA